MDGAAIALLLTVNVTRVLCYATRRNGLFWIVRCKQSGEAGGYNSVMEEKGSYLEPFVRLLADPSRGMDWERLDMLLQYRASIYDDEKPGRCPHWIFRRDGTKRSTTELQRDAMEVSLSLSLSLSLSRARSVCVCACVLDGCVLDAYTHVSHDRHPGDAATADVHSRQPHEDLHTAGQANSHRRSGARRARK